VLPTMQRNQARGERISRMHDAREGEVREATWKERELPDEEADQVGDPTYQPRRNAAASGLPEPPATSPRSHGRTSHRASAEAQPGARRCGTARRNAMAPPATERTLGGSLPDQHLGSWRQNLERKTRAGSD
jgi:hypothetical protein